MFPLHARTSPDRAHRVIAAVWITSAVLACPSLFYRELYSIKWANFTSWQCDEFWPTEKHFDPKLEQCVITYDARKVFYVALTIALYFLPVAVMFINYSLVVWRLWMSRLPGEHSAPARHTATRAKKKVVKMVSVVLIIFVLCWTPLQTIILYDFVRANNNSLPEWFSVVEFSAYFVAYSNSALNPIIYCGFNANFRQGLVSLLTCRRSSTGRIYHQRWTTKWTVGHDRMDLPGSNCKGMTIGTRETTVGLSGPEPAVLLEFNSLRNSSRYPQRCSVTAQSGRMLMSASATDIRNIAFTDLHPDYPSKRFGGGVCRSESQCASPAITSTVFPDDQPHHAPTRPAKVGYSTLAASRVRMATG
ncbi:substance-P receptor-like isoform X1 [Macrobrachium rosenbergii]|uniref:substance-P receptor-like isoform X1 n=1 Tax=Macrobrachium rosenbergii TaxID=79674 RepID=UPI0034D5C30D